MSLVVETLQKALKHLEIERVRIEKQITAIEAALESDASPRPARARAKRRLTDSHRRAISRRMKEYWAGRRAMPRAQRAGER